MPEWLSISDFFIPVPLIAVGAVVFEFMMLVGVAGVLVLGARRILRTAPTPGERTRESLKEDARWARRQIAR